MSKKRNLIGGMMFLVIVAVIGFAGYRMNFFSNRAAADKASPAIPISFSKDQQLIVNASTRVGKTGEDDSIYIDSLVLAGYFTKDSKVVTRHTEWGTSPLELTNKTTEAPLDELSLGDAEYIHISADKIGYKDMQPGMQYFYRTVLTMDGQAYNGPVAVFSLQKE